MGTSFIPLHVPVSLIERMILAFQNRWHCILRGTCQVICDHWLPKQMHVHITWCHYRFASFRLYRVTIAYAVTGYRKG